MAIPGVLILFCLTTTFFLWLAMYIYTFDEEGWTHPWDNSLASLCVDACAVILYILGHIVWLVLSLTEPSLDLVWWHAVVSLIVIFLISVGGGIETAKHDLRRYYDYLEPVNIRT